MSYKVETAEAYLTDDLGMVDVTRQERKHAVVYERTVNGRTTSILMALSASSTSPAPSPTK
jgi:hypothetical protein